MAQALAEVKRDLGKDAVILRTRAFKSGGVLGLGSENVVEITAAAASTITAERSATPSSEQADAQDFEPIGFPVRSWNQLAEETPLFVQKGRPPAPESTPTRRGPAPSTVPPPPASEPARAAPPGAHARDLPKPSAPSDRASEPRPVLPATFAEFKPADDAALAAIRSELATIRQLVGQVLETTPKPNRIGPASPAPVRGALGLGPVPPAVMPIYLALQEAGVEPDIIEDLSGEVVDQLRPDEIDDAQLVHQAALGFLARRIACAADPTLVRIEPGRRCRKIAFIGPTGVGKTTTIAKLAAAYKLRYGLRVGLLTSDTYRVAAVDQLRVYADIIGLPLKVVASPAEMQPALDEFQRDDGDQQVDVVLIDTAGRSQHDAAKLGELSDSLAAADPDDVNLVLSLTSSDAVLSRAADRFSKLRPDRLILTKLDEAVTFGAMLNVVRRLKLPLSYVTTGQEVPDQIEAADAMALARRILGSPATGMV